MKSEVKGSIFFSIPKLNFNFKSRQVATSPRYRWNCYDRGNVPFAMVQWTYSGEGVFACERGTFKVPVGHAFVAIVPEQSSYYYPPEATQPWTFGWFNVYGSIACDIFRRFRAEFGSVVPLPQQSAAATEFRHLIGYFSNPKGVDRYQISLKAYSFALEWWREASQQTATMEDGMERAIRFCREHFREQLSVKQIAYEIGMSREHFSRVFSERLRETPAAFLRRLRLDEAVALLGNTQLPLAEIGVRSGFYSVRHMMRAFQRAYGVGPSLYRRRMASAKK